MKLWERTVLLMLATLFTALVVVGGVTLYFTCDKSIDAAATAYHKRLELSGAMWNQIWDDEVFDKASEAAKKSYLKMQFDNFYGNGYALVLEHDIVINKTGFSITDLSPVRDNKEKINLIQHLNDKYYLLQNTYLDKPEHYMVFGIADVTDKFFEIRRLVILYLIVYLTIFLVAGIFIYWMMRRNFLEMEKLQETAKKQEELLGSLAHEMKTPLTSIIGYSDSLLHVKLPEDMQKKSLLHINREGHRLEILTGKIMQLVGLYRNEAISFAVHPVRELLERVEELEKYRLDAAGIHLEVARTDFDLNMDIDLMESLLLNLIDNAVRASEKGSKIILSAEEQDGRKRISVQDEGEGIPEEEIGKITDAFYMVDKSRSRKAGGAGLGLALCQKIVKLHGGYMEITSKVNEGTTVTIIL